MMTEQERASALARMDETIRRFYSSAIQIGNHPFIEFAGVMAAYLKSCQRAHEAGIDFTECNQHAGHELPMESFEITYLAEKLNCIFGDRITATTKGDTHS
ncbi:MAG: hypothetical protein GAK28_04342 [Luteibacter sp.]|uniref:hypothetical protein n=1 Tax=Luteibacter sp. TaxID=1886636 RepID=UPI001380562A|nr:hypothetical protein [Luteibacter sp.]KAF1003879.1 MAG: hypothetical protein GAK28_04342 [Luteibacter sp.]